MDLKLEVVADYANMCATSTLFKVYATAQEKREAPLGAVVQAEVSNHLKLLWLIARVMSIKEKSRQRIAAGVYQEGERKRIIDEMSKSTDI